MNEYAKLPQDYADDSMPPERFNCCRAHSVAGGSFRGKGFEEKVPVPE